MGRADRQGLPRLHAARDPAERAGHRGADRAGHPRQFDLAALAGRRRRVAASADRGDEARLRRRLPLRRRSARDGGDARADARRRLPGRAREADRPEEGARRLRLGKPRQGRHDLPDRRRRERHDGELHPEQLHGLRLGRASCRTPASACRTAATASRCDREAPNLVAPRQAAVPHDHPGVPHAEDGAAA